jgi:hypothetical protein
MSELTKLRNANSLSDLAMILGFKPKALSYILYKKPKETLYKKFEIPKKNGETRTISAPCDELKLLQTQVARLLQKCIDEIDLQKKIKSRGNGHKTPKQQSLSHGFKKKYSILTNGRQHRNKRVVLNIDLHDFFGTIHFGRVLGFFSKDQNFQIPYEIALLLTQIVCHDKKLPQGSPASPIISNLIAHILDIKLAKLASANKCTYSRYADDITFSTNTAELSSQIAIPHPSNPHRWSIGSDLQNIIKQCGFSVNIRKTRVQYKTSRQEVTGLVVNRKINIKSEYQRNAKAMAHSLFHKGTFTITRQLEPGKPLKIEGTTNQLGGIFSFIYMVNLYNRRLAESNSPLPKKDHPKLKSIEETHRKFIFFRDFYANVTPTIVCEGKTDNIYIRNAIRNLSNHFPSLVKTNKAGNKELTIKLFNYSDQIKYLLGITGGTGDMMKLVSNYPKECSFFKSIGGMQPVILLIDNDDGAHGIYTKIQKFHKLAVKPDGSQAFYFYSNNLYIVPTPLANDGSPTMIEDLFDPSLLKTLLNGKKFNPNDKITTSTEYSKNHFAEFVVKPNQETINFDGFKPLLSTIHDIIINHAKLVLLANSKP